MLVLDDHQHLAVADADGLTLALKPDSQDKTAIEILSLPTPAV